MRERPAQLATSFVAISLGIGLVVAVKTVGHFSEKAVARQLDQLGTNVLILPKGVSVSDYYSADLSGEEMPESYVERITNSTLEGVDNLSPKLTTRVRVGEHEALLTGILPKDEFAGKALWAEAAGIFTRPEGCGTATSLLPLAGLGSSDGGTHRTTVVEALAPDEALLGSRVAQQLGLHPGDKLRLRGRAFVVKQVLPETGTTDDDRIFANLHTVQGMIGKPGEISGIEMMGCCKEISKGLIADLNRLLPDARVVTIKQIVATQARTNGLMEKLALVFLTVIVAVGGASIANYMQSNVEQRKREIGTFMAVGMPRRKLLCVFLWKGLFLGAAGGLAGYLLGTTLAVMLGPQIARAPVLPLPSWIGWSLLLSVSISALASLLPAARAARLDPVVALREL